MSKGKIAAQAAHAAVDCAFSSNKKLFSNWRAQGMKKIALRIESIDELKNLLQKAEDMNLTISMIKDAGKTEVEPGTVTCGAIGPAPEVQIDKITGHLKSL